MAWTKDVTIGPFGATIRTTVTLLSQSLAANTSLVRIVVAIYKGSGSNNAYDSSVSTSISGTVSTSKTMAIDVPSNSWFYLWDQNFTIAHGSDGRKSFSITGTLGPTGTSTFGDGGSATVSGTLPALILKPSKPTWGSMTYLSASSIRASWSNNATARGPYDRIDIQRWDRTTGKWWEKGRLSATATSFTDSSLPANSEVKYRVQAVGPGGVSGWVEGGTLGTTPAAPTSVSALKSGSDITVSWTDNAARTQRTRVFYVQDNPGGAGWVDVGSIGGSATSWTHLTPDPAKTHQYRVQARIATGGLTLSSAWSSASAVVQLQAAPGQPGRVAPQDGVPQGVEATLTLQWKHNPVDTTAQTAAELQWRVDGGAWTTVSVVGSQSTVDVTPAPATARAQFEWQVRTKGDHPDWSPWSTTGGPLLSTRPGATLQAPSDVVATSRLDVSWTYSPGGVESQLAQAGWQVILVDWATGTMLETRTGTTQELVALTTRLTNATEYVVQLKVRNGDGLWSDTIVQQFTADFPLPQPVLVFPEWDREMASVSVGFSVQEVPGHTEVDAIDVERRDAGGDWVLIASGVSTLTTITDSTPRIGMVEYRAISRTVLPTETVGPTGTVHWPGPIRGAVVSGGSGFDRVCTAMGSAASDEPGIEQATRRFAGVPQPVAFFGPGRTHQLSFSGTIPLTPNTTTVSSREEWTALLHEHGVVCYRDPVGRKVFGIMTVSFSQSGPVESLSLSVEEVQWTESVRRISDLELEAMLSGV